MIDTVILAIPRDKFTTLYATQGIFPQWTQQGVGKNHKIWIKNAPKQKNDTDPYFPRLTAYNRQDFRKRAISKINNIEFSVPKLLYNNNLNELEEKDFPTVIDVLQKRLLEMGEAITKSDLESAVVAGFDPAKNIELSDGYTACGVIRELGKINISKKLELTKVTFKNDGQGLQIYSKVHSVVFYDKIADLNQKKGRAIDKDQTPLQLSLFKAIKQEEPFIEILRLEVRLRNRQKFNSILKNLGFTENPTFKDIFKKDVCQKVVRWYWDTIIKGENTFLFELENNPKRLLRKILRNNREIKAKEAVYLIGLSVLCKDEGGIRQLRQMVEKRIKQRNWYRINDNIKSLNAFTNTTGLHSWVKQIDDCLLNFKSYKARSP
jgi:hypothetical protein